MEFIYGVSDWCTLSRTCRVDWEAWATVSTAFAVILAAVALIAESKRTTQIQRSEWDRADNLRREDRRQAEIDQLHDGLLLAGMLNKEITIFIGRLGLVINLIDECKSVDDYRESILSLKNHWPNGALPMTAQHTGRLRNLPTPAAFAVIAVTVYHFSFGAKINSDSESLEDVPDANVIAWMKSYQQLAERALHVAESAQGELTLFLANNANYPNQTTPPQE